MGTVNLPAVYLFILYSLFINVFQIESRSDKQKSTNLSNAIYSSSETPKTNSSSDNTTNNSRTDTSIRTAHLLEFHFSLLVVLFLIITIIYLCIYVLFVYIQLKDVFNFESSQNTGSFLTTRRTTSFRFTRLENESTPQNNKRDASSQTT